MNGTIEINHTNFLVKLSIVEHIISILTATKKYNIDAIIETYTNIKDDYEISTVNILSDYYTSSKNSMLNSIVSDTYVTCIVSNNYDNKLTKCMGTIDMLINNDNPVRKQISLLMKKFNSYAITAEIPKIQYSICQCGESMRIFPENSELVCQSCGHVFTLYGTAFEDTQISGQTGLKFKHGCYDPSRHCKFWIQRIQARENADISQGCIQKIKKCIERDLIVARKLKCSQVRLYLKETGQTDFNDHVPLIRKIITGISPPQLTSDEIRKLVNLFDKAAAAYEEIKPCGKSNTMYYPYIIFKILDFMLENGYRKQKILECIHLQGRDTLISNDNTWESVCSLIDIRYKPTDRCDQFNFEC
jgi:hypothetical protein